MSAFGKGRRVARTGGTQSAMKLSGSCLAVASGLLALTAAGSAEAQTWSAMRTTPALFHIIAVDRTGETLWPYGREDVAGDGLGTFQADEREADLRSIYADVENDHLLLRAYVSAESAPSMRTVAFFFIDADDRATTGGPAFQDALWRLAADPTPGGYERAVAVRGDGALVGTYRWDADEEAWVETQEPAPRVRFEAGLDVDPLRFGADERGYFQVSLHHEISGLNASCAGNIFVRTHHEVEDGRSFGDDTLELFACRAPTDPYGDPVVLRPDRCDKDDDCPADGVCREGVCLFAYACTDHIHCRARERCQGNICVREVSGSCDEDADCDGLVCEGGACVACAETGARACEGELVCSPNGSCLDPDDFTPGPGNGGNGGGAGEDESYVGRTQGGAFRCSAGGPNDTPGTRSLWLVALGMAALGFRIKRSRGAARHRSVESRDQGQA